MKEVSPLALSLGLEILDRLGDAVLAVSIEGRIRFANRAAQQLFQLADADLEGQTFLDVLLRSDFSSQEDIREQMALAFEGNIQLTVEVAIGTRDANSRRVEILLQREVVAEEILVIASIRDLGHVSRLNTAIRESEEKFSKVFNGSSNGVAVTEFDSGKILDVNATWVKFTGIERRNALGRTALELGLWPDSQSRQEIVDSLRLENKILDRETEFFMRGRRQPFLVSADRLEMGGKSYTLWEFRNIAARKEAQAELQKSEEKYRALVETAHDLIWSADAQGRWTFVNKRGAREIYGLEPDEMVGKPITEFQENAGVSWDLGVLQALAQGQGVFGFETRHRTKDAALVDLSFNAIPTLDGQGNLVGATGTARDITSQKSVEKALRITAQRLLLAQKSGKLGVWEFTPSTGELWWDDLNYDLFGADPGDPRRPMEIWKAVLPEDERALAEGKVLDAIQRGSTLQDTLRIVTEAGEVRYIEAHGSIILDDAGSPLRIVGLNADITERRKLEEQLRLSQKMEAVGQLAGGIAHDFNNLLSVIIGYTDIVLSDMPPADPFREDLDQVLKAANRASSLTRQLLAFSRRSRMDLKVVDLCQVVTEAEILLRRMIGENVELVISLDSGAPRIRADANQITQVLINLVLNARDALPEGGVLRIQTRSFVIHEGVEKVVDDLAPGTYAVLQVIDNGTGIPGDVLNRIFEPFYTTKEQGKGTGLGLSVAHGIVKQTGGCITVESTLGLGSAFSVYLPASEDTVAHSTRTSSEDGKGTERILVVEDEYAVRMIAERSLVSHGYRAVTASDGYEALDILAKDGEFDLVVTDVVMPRMTGLQLAGAATALYPSLRVLFMSGYTPDEVTRHGIVGGEVSLLQKPFTADSLAGAVRRALDFP